MNAFIRTELLLSKENLDILKKKHVAIFGLGGVGSYAVEILARCGIEHLTMIDNDIITSSNINRQLYALNSTISRKKIEVAKERVLDINPLCKIQIFDTFILKETIDNINFNNFDYIIDAIDTISGKILIIEKAKKLNIPIISSMGTANKLDPNQFIITDIHKTSVCPLARIMRHELKKRNIKDVKVIFSKEETIKQNISKFESEFNEKEKSNNQQILGSVAFVPSIAGILIAREVIFDLVKLNNIKSQSN